MSCQASTEDTTDNPNPSISFTLDKVPATLPTENVWIITDDIMKNKEQLYALKDLLDKAKADNREITLEFQNITIIIPLAFQYWTSLTRVSFPKATTIEGYHVFRGCTSLTTLSLPKVTTIGANAFQDWTSLTTMTIATGDTSFISLGTNPFGLSADTDYTANITITTGSEENKRKLALAENFDGTVIVE